MTIPAKKGIAGAGHDVNTGFYIEIALAPGNRRFNIAVVVVQVINPRQFGLPGITIIKAVGNFTKNGIIKDAPEIYCFKTNGVGILGLHFIRILQ